MGNAVIQAEAIVKTPFQSFPRKRLCRNSVFVIPCKRSAACPGLDSGTRNPVLSIIMSMSWIPVFTGMTERREGVSLVKRPIRHSGQPEAYKLQPEASCYVIG